MQTATYTAGSPEAAAFSTLNSERGACGFGFLKQSTKLDAAATDANLYFANRAAESYASASAYSHLEDASKSGFTGQLPDDRAAFRGYNDSLPTDVNEDNATLYSKPASQATNLAISNAQVVALLTSVYHLSGLMTARTETGFSFTRVTTSDGYDAGRLNLLVGIPAGDQRQVATTVRTYPCAGTTGVSGSFIPANESPNPAPDLASQTVGTPIYVNGPEGQTLAVTSAVVTATGSQTSVGNRVITYDNDTFYVTNGFHALTPNEAFVLPLAPLVDGQSYTVTLTGTSDGTPFTTSFAFVPSK